MEGHPLKKLKQQSVEEFEREFSTRYEKPCVSIVNKRPKEEEVKKEIIIAPIKERDVAKSAAESEEPAKKKKPSLFAQRLKSKQTTEGQAFPEAFKVEIPLATSATA